MTNHSSKNNSGSGELAPQPQLTPEQIEANWQLVQNRCLANNQEVNPNLVDTPANVHAHGFVWYNGRRINRQ